MQNRTFVSAIIPVLVLLAPGPVHGSYREDVGWNKLVAEMGEDIPLGRGIKVSLIESPSLGHYQPDRNNFEFSGKTFHIRSQESGVSSHATVVGQRFFGSFSSMAYGIDVIDVYESVNWLDVFLNTDSGQSPAVETSRIQNHSWTGSYSAHDNNIKAIRRLDHAIERDRFVAVVALGNETTDVRPLLAHAYNVISVGRPSGTHSRGGTWFDGPGRSRPDLVTPGGFFTSFSAPVVSSAAAVLLEEADRTPALVAARDSPQVIKALLMAGAAKSTFPEWTRSDEKPLDEIFGAGQLNIYRSYHILTGGNRNPDTDNFVSPAGWHLGHLAAEDEHHWRFSFDGEQETFTAHLTWHRLIDLQGGEDYLSAEIFSAGFELRLFEITEDEFGSEVQVSLDPVNNNQHLYIENLAPGEYAIQVTRVDDSVPFEFAYAIAWDAVALVPPEPVTFAEWRQRFFAGELDDLEVSGSAADPDGDGVSNLLEYALGGNPRVADPTILPKSGTVTEGEVDYLSLTFTRRVGLQDIQYQIDASSGFSDWAEGVGLLLDWESNPDGTITETYRDPEPMNAGARRFLRLSISLEE